MKTPVEKGIEKPFICRYCGKEFKYMMDRDYHLKTHPSHFEKMYRAMLKDKENALRITHKETKKKYEEEIKKLKQQLQQKLEE